MRLPPDRPQLLAATGVAVSVSLFLIVKSPMKRVLFLCEVLHVMDVRGINVWEELEGDFSFRYRIFR